MFGFGFVSPLAPAGHILPTVANTFNLGSSIRPFNNLYLRTNVVLNSAVGAFTGLYQTNNDAASVVCGGNTLSVGAGAYVAAYGISYVGVRGLLSLQAGNHAESHITLKTNHASALLQFRLSADARQIAFRAPNDTELYMMFGNGSVAGQTLYVFGQRSDGFDDGAVFINGGGGDASTRGAIIRAHGNEHASKGGLLELFGGAVSGAEVRIGPIANSNLVLYQNNLVRFRLLSGGHLTQDATNGGDIIFSKSGSRLRFTSDSGAFSIAGGSAADHATGAYISLHGTSHANTGQLWLQAGNNATGHLLLFLNNNAAEFRLHRAGGLRAWYMLGSAGHLYNDATNGGSIMLQRPGSSIHFFAGTDQMAGSVNLVAGTATVTNANVAVQSNIYLTRSTLGDAPGHLSYTKSAGVGFTINSSNASDNGQINYWISNIY